MIAAPEGFAEQNHYCEQLQSAHYHQGAEIELQQRMEHGEVPCRRCITEGGTGVAQHRQSCCDGGLHRKALE